MGSEGNGGASSVGSGGCCCDVDVGRVSLSDISPSSAGSSAGGASLGRGGWFEEDSCSLLVAVGALVVSVTREVASSGSLDRLRLLFDGLDMSGKSEGGV